jgi:broad specificity phosphatase PhoE
MVRHAKSSRQISSKLNTKKIYIVRHGQTDYNLKGIVQGSGVDSSLNDFGRAQTLAFYNAYKHIVFDKVYTSVLKRTIESVEHFVRDGIPNERLAGLNEISWGRKEGQPITPEEDAYYNYVLAQWQQGETNLRIEGGESPEDVVKRMQPAVDHILKQDERTVLICMHGRAIRILLCILLNYPLRSMDMFEHENACLYLLNYTGTMFSVELYNDTAHLHALKHNPVQVR